MELRLTLVILAAVLLEGNLQLLAGLVLVQDGELVDVRYPGACNSIGQSVLLWSVYFRLDIPCTEGWSSPKEYSTRNRIGDRMSIVPCFK